ncbi:TolC family protein, partial [Acinetobacter baumannii]
MMKSLFSFSAFLICTATFAQKRLALDEAISIALKNNLDIQIAKDNVDISVFNNNVGIAGGLPTVTGTASDQETIANI